MVRVTLHQHSYSCYHHHTGTNGSCYADRVCGGEMWMYVPGTHYWHFCRECGKLTQNSYLGDMSSTENSTLVQTDTGQTIAYCKIHRCGYTVRKFICTLDETTPMCGFP